MYSLGINGVEMVTKSAAWLEPSPNSLSWIGKFAISIYLLQPWLLSGRIRIEVLIGIITGIIFLRQNISLPKLELMSIFIVLFALALPPVIHLTGDISYFYVGIKILVYGLLAYIINRAFNPNRVELISIIRLIAIGSLAFFLSCVLFESMRDIALSFKGETYGIQELLEAYRLWFPSSGHTFHLGVFFLILLLMQIRLQEKLWAIFPTLFCCVIASRSAMILGCLALFFLYFRKYPLAMIFALIVMVGGIFLIWSNFAEYSEIRYVLEPFFKLLDGDQLSSGSTDDLISKHIFLPSTGELLIGSGNYFNHDGSFYGGTDSGYIRPTLYGGLLLTLLQTTILGVLSIATFGYSFTGVIATLFILILNIKAEIFTGGIQMAALIFFYFSMKLTKHDN